MSDCDVFEYENFEHKHKCVEEELNKIKKDLDFNKNVITTFYELITTRKSNSVLNGDIYKDFFVLYKKIKKDVNYSNCKNEECFKDLYDKLQTNLKNQQEFVEYVENNYHLTKALPLAKNMHNLTK
jgi:septation ring formation regulator EzrA